MAQYLDIEGTKILANKIKEKAPLASPALTGTPTAPTASAGTNTTQVATTAFVATAINNKTSVSGNAGTATKLATARTINGVSFDGTQNITIVDSTKVPLSTGNAITIHADSDSSSTDEYLLLKAGGNELKIASNAGGSSPVKSNTSLTFNGNTIYHSGNKPSKSDIGLGNVTNESKATMFTNAALTGVPTAPTATSGTNSTQIATTAFVKNEVSALVNSAPSTLDTLQELASALGNDPNFATTVSTQLGLKAPLASPALTGTPTAPTAASGTNTTQIATTAFVTTAINNKTSVTGNASTATKLATSRGFTVGNTKKTFDGSADVAWTLSEIGAAAAYSASYAFGGTRGAITTTAFIEILKTLGAFNQPYWMSRGSWKYADNSYISDTGVGNIHLAGCTVEVLGNEGAFTIKIHTPTTTQDGVINGDFVYINNGTDYSPGWRRMYNTSYKPTASDVGLGNVTNESKTTMFTNAALTGTPTAPTATSGTNTTQIATTAFVTAAINNKTSVTGNAATATKLATARGLTIGNTKKTFDGSADVSWSLSEIGAAASSHTHNYAASSSAGGAATTALTCTGNSATATKLATARTISLTGSVTGSGSFDGSGNLSIATTTNHTHNYAGSSSAGGAATSALTCTGNSATATKLATARTIALTGDTTGSGSFDGSGNLSISTTTRMTAFVGSDTASTSGWYKVASQTCSGYGDTNITFMVTSTYSNYNVGILQLQIRSDSTSISCKRLSWLVRAGLSTSHYIVTISGMTWTLYAYQPSSQYGRLCFEISSMSNINGKNMSWTLDFANNGTKETTTPTATVTSSDGGTVSYANSSGSATSAAKLTTSRGLTIGSTKKTFDGSADVSWTLSEIGAAASSHTHSYAGSSSAGGAATSALACTGNSATATKLQTARTIALTGSVTGSGSFDGSGNLSITTTTNHTHNYAGSSSAGGAATTALTCTGNSATATKATQDSDGKQINTTYVKKSMTWNELEGV